MSQVYGYIRVSTQEQNLDRQLIAMDEYGVPRENIFSDHGFSGKDFNRPAYREIIAKLEARDTLVIKSIDRLGRNYDEIVDEWRLITRKMEVDIVVLDMPILNIPLLNSEVGITDVTSRLISAIFLEVMSCFAQLEREKIHERQKEGIVAAKAKGVKFGRPPKERTPEFYIRMGQYLDGEITIREAAGFLGISHSTFLRWVKEQTGPEVA
ncbi:MAG: recombinase family protein [Clostridiales bacterium]|nr:recombinase family protein [Clostridiales bacterium]MCD8108888.1 recombinase family protein [Clostridiales bacterium]